MATVCSGNTDELMLSVKQAYIIKIYHTSEACRVIGFMVVSGTLCNVVKNQTSSLKSKFHTLTTIDLDNKTKVLGSIQLDKAEMQQAYSNMKALSSTKKTLSTLMCGFNVSDYYCWVASCARI